MQLVRSQEDKLARLEQMVHKLENEQLPSRNRLEERLEALEETTSSLMIKVEEILKQLKAVERR
jgi:exonuclease VII small subunit